MTRFALTAVAALLTFASFGSHAVHATGMAVPAATAAASDPVGGPTSKVDTINALSFSIYYVEVWGNETTAISIEGDGDTDLDLYVYDSDGRLIAAGESYSDRETLYIDAAYRDTLIIKVVNRGTVWNRFLLRAW